MPQKMTISMKTLFGLAGVLLFVLPWEFMDTKPAFAWGFRLLACTAIWDGWLDLKAHRTGEGVEDPSESFLKVPFFRVGAYIVMAGMLPCILYFAYLTIKGIVTGSIH